MAIRDNRDYCKKKTTFEKHLPVTQSAVSISLNLANRILERQLDG